MKEKVPLKITFELGRTKKTIKELLLVKKNTLYKLENSKKDIVSIVIGTKKIGEGTIKIKEGKFYVQIVSLNNDNRGE